MKDTINTHPLSFPQKSLWLISQSGVDNGAYNLHLRMRIKTSIGIHKIEMLFQEASVKIIRRHSQLRANFILKDDEPAQIIHPSIDFSVQVVDCTALTGEELDNRIWDYSLKPFNLRERHFIQAILAFTA